MLVLDASVWVNADSPAEPGHPHSRALLDALAASTSPSVAAPLLLPVEVAGVVSRTRAQPELAYEIAEAMLALPFVRWQALDDSLGRRAFALAAAHRLRGADAIYAAVAALHDCPLVTLDQEQLRRLPPAVRTLTPQQACESLNITPVGPRQP
jgi:predicted nucleic acid-binding protein